MSAPTAIQPSLFPAEPVDWKVHLRRDYNDLWLRSLEEAQTRLGYHERHHTVQTSEREQLPRDLAEEWFHLMGEAALSVLLAQRDLKSEPLGWGEQSARARQRSREGNVIRGVSVYVPRIEGGGLIIRQAEAEATPDLIFVLMRLMRYGTEHEYLKAYGYQRAKEGWESGSNFGHNGTKLRDPGDRLVTYLLPMSTFNP